MPDLWDPNPDHVFDTPETSADPPPGGRHPRRVELRDGDGRLRPPAYILIALVIALAAVLVVTVALLIGPG